MLDPWIFRKLSAVAAGLPMPPEPTVAEKIGFLQRHFELMRQQFGDHSCILIRKFAAWYGARLGVPEDLEDRLRRVESPAAFLSLTREMSERHGQRRTTVATALIKTPNGPNALW
jgi:tRNA-dihydrouridine synthase